MVPAAWSTQQLAEFVVSVSTADSEEAAALTAVERGAEALDADVAAIVGGGEVVAAVGYAHGTAPVAELEAVRPGAEGSSLEVPGVGTCAAAAAPLEYPPGATFVVARPGPDRLTREDTGLLRSMARVASLTMHMLHLLGEERAARDQLTELAREQAALRRVATLVAEAAAPDAVFSAVAEEVGRLLSVDLTVLARYDPEDAFTVLGAWSPTGDTPPIGLPRPLSERGVTTLVRETGRPARLDFDVDSRHAAPASALKLGIRSAFGAPINIEGRTWGVAIVASTCEGPPPPDTEERLAAFTELVATAIANAQAQAELTASRARIVATADETRRRIERDLHDGAQQRLVSLALQLQAAREVVPPELDALAAELDGVAAGLNDALDDLREFARGIHPAILAEGGLAAALSTLARRSAVAVALDVRVHERLPEPIEVGAYYVVSEALANAAKHAKASSAVVDVEARGGVLRISVRDDGVGGADFAHGSGLVGLKDRVEALGGRISLDSPRGAGTSVEVELPLTAGAAVALGYSSR